MFLLSGVAVNLPRVRFRSQGGVMVGKTGKSGPPFAVSTFEGAGLWDVAGPHAENTTPRQSVNGTRLLRMSGPEAPLRRGAVPQLERQ